MLRTFSFSHTYILTHRHIQDYLETRLIKARYVSGIFSHTHNVRHIEGYLPPFKYILGRFRHIQNLGAVRHFIYIRAYSERMAYSGMFRTVDIFSHFHPLLKSNSCILRFRHIQNSGLFRHVMFRYIYKVTHIKAYFLTLGFGHIQDPGITDSNNTKQDLLFKSGSTFKLLIRSVWKSFSFFVSKVNIQQFFSRQCSRNNSNNNSNNNSMQPTLACHPLHPRQHATHPTLARQASTPPTLVRIARHVSKSKKKKKKT